jgi:hypothetical protein
MNLTAFSKLSSIKLAKLAIALLSIKIVSFAVLIILSIFFKL